MDNRESVGVVSAHYFVGRAFLLKWINDLTHLNYTRIEQTASGVFACHVFDALYPGQIRLEKVKFNARQEYEFIHNYKILQACFNRVGMKRQIDVEKLIKGKYQDNLEFIQWVKAYYDSHACERALQYDGRARREEVLDRKGTPSALTLRAPLRDVPMKSSSSKDLHGKPDPQGSSLTRTQSSPRSRPPLYASQKGAQTAVGAGVSRTQLAQLKEEIEALKDENENQRTLMAEIETEKNFYFNKLRKIELILQEFENYEGNEDLAVLNVFREGYADIKEALYAEDDVALDNPGEEAPYEDAVDGETLEQDPKFQSDALLPKVE